MDVFDQMLKATGLEVATDAEKTRKNTVNNPKTIVLNNIKDGIEAARSGAHKGACWQAHPIHKDKYLVKLRYGTKAVILNEKAKNGLQVITDKDNKSLIKALEGLEKYVSDGHADIAIEKLAAEQAQALIEGQARNKAWVEAYPELAKDYKTRGKYLKAMKEAGQDANDVEWAIKDGSKIATKVVVASEKADKPKGTGNKTKATTKQPETVIRDVDKETEETLANIDPKVLAALMAKITKK